jgi:aarF domain-containing kinase
LVTPDGRLGLIDYGQCKTITQSDRRNIARLILLLSQGPSKQDQVVSLARELGFETTCNDPFVIYKICSLFFDRDDLGVTDGMGLQMYVEQLNNRDTGKALPDQYILAARMCVILRGLSVILGPNHPPISLAYRWKGLAQRAVYMYPEDYETDDYKPAFM